MKELDPHVLKCVKDANGNHVIQKSIERVASERLGLISAFRGNVDDPYSSVWMSRTSAMFRVPTEDQIRPLMDELWKYMINLMQGEFGLRTLYKFPHTTAIKIGAPG
ncbi:hypothetical protein EDC04DRAFT_2715336 [Pisolithus marmoratus]|nr:hypothetical protein EDC04DRAFT_2715336 [Pisolithus marmoratus]